MGSLRTQLVLQTSQLVLSSHTPRSRKAQWTPKSEVKGMGIVCYDPSETLLAEVTLFCSGGWDPGASAPPPSS